MHKTEGLVKWPIVYLIHIKILYVEKINLVVICGTSDNMATWVQTDKYGDINTRDTTTMATM